MDGGVVSWGQQSHAQCTGAMAANLFEEVVDLRMATPEEQRLRRLVSGGRDEVHGVFYSASGMQRTPLCAEQWRVRHRPHVQRLLRSGMHTCCFRILGVRPRQCSSRRNSAVKRDGWCGEACSIPKRGDGRARGRHPSWASGHGRSERCARSAEQLSSRASTAVASTLRRCPAAPGAGGAARARKTAGVATFFRAAAACAAQVRPARARDFDTPRHAHRHPTHHCRHASPRRLVRIVATHPCRYRRRRLSPSHPLLLKQQSAGTRSTLEVFRALSCRRRADPPPSSDPLVHISGSTCLLVQLGPCLK